MTVLAGMKKPNDHAEPTKVERYKNVYATRYNCLIHLFSKQIISADSIKFYKCVSIQSIDQVKKTSAKGIYLYIYIYKTRVGLIGLNIEITREIY